MKGCNEMLISEYVEIELNNENIRYLTNHVREDLLRNEIQENFLGYRNDIEDIDRKIVDRTLHDIKKNQDDLANEGWYYKDYNLTDEDFEQENFEINPYKNIIGEIAQEISNEDKKDVIDLDEDYEGHTLNDFQGLTMALDLNILPITDKFCIYLECDFCGNRFEMNLKDYWNRKNQKDQCENCCESFY